MERSLAPERGRRAAGSFKAPRLQPRGEREQGCGSRAPRGTAGKGRGAATLVKRSGARAAASPAAAATRETDSSCGGGRNPRPCPAPREEHEGGRGGESDGGGWARQTDLLGGSQGASEGALRGGATAARRPRRTVLLGGRPPARNRSAAPGHPGAGPGRMVHPRGCHSQLRAGTYLRWGYPGRTCQLTEGVCTWRSNPSPALNAPPRTPPPPHATPFHAPPEAGSGSLGPGASGPRPSSANSPGCFSASMQVPGNFFCLMEH